MVIALQEHNYSVKQEQENKNVNQKQANLITRTEGIITGRARRTGARHTAGCLPMGVRQVVSKQRHADRTGETLRCSAQLFIRRRSGTDTEKGGTERTKTGIWPEEKGSGDSAGGIGAASASRFGGVLLWEQTGAENRKHRTNFWSIGCRPRTKRFY